MILWINRNLCSKQQFTVKKTLKLKLNNREWKTFPIFLSTNSYELPLCASGNLNISAVFLLSAITRNHSTSLISINIRKLIIIGITDKRTYICAWKPYHSLIFICIFVFAWYFSKGTRGRVKGHHTSTPQFS